MIKNSSNTGEVADWGADFSDRVLTLAVSSDGSELYAGGYFSSIGALERSHIAKLSAADATVVPDWNPDAGGTVNSLLLEGNDLYVGGWFYWMGGVRRLRIAKLAADTAIVDDAWNPEADGTVYALGLSGTDLYVGGYFTEIGGQQRNKLAKLNAATGNAVIDWNADADNSVRTLAVKDNALFVGGDFTQIGGEDRNRIAKVNTTDGAVDPNWNPDANNRVLTLALSGNGADLYMGGRFNQVGGTNRQSIAQVTTVDGTLDPDWNPSAEYGEDVLALAMSDTGIYAGGKFSRIGGKTTALGHVVDGHLLTVTVTTTSNEARKGVITSTPEGILCSPGSLYDCEHALVADDFILTTTSSDPDITIGQEWLSGCDTAGGLTATCGLTLDENKTVEVELSCETYDIPAPDEPVTSMYPNCNNIKATQGFIVGDDASVRFTAGNSVELGPGFRVSAAPRYFSVVIQ